ncbi:translocation/assembly module TamB domain-containing protein [Breoghania sp. L-A4]|uniref:translocation/assembly module TamB domain-containing protein n=1 Tax=Breoghania sp. L-A4 TaxID=2304600 RepID=UPI000E35FAA5|nr:translocation/assembly module TamB domain-containing protein [Breoghania sp. L-A4]AXS41627.1 hypothetical protein D1F64_18520 [Breoghania sp. L-A4]
MRRISKILILLLLVVVALPAALVAVLFTRPGGALLARVVSSSASTPQAGIDVSAIRLDWDGLARIDSVTMTDARGRWLSAEGIEMQWHPLALLRGAVKVDRLSVSAIAVERKPVAAETAEASGGGLPAIPVDVDVDALRINDISLGAEIAGAPVRLFADGSLHLRASELTGSLKIQRDDDIAGRLDADVAFQPDQRTLRFSLRASEPGGGVIARLLDIGALPAIDVRLEGDGPLDNWRSDLTIALDDVPTVTGRATLEETADENRQLRFALDGQLARLLPEGIRPLFAGSTTARGDIRLDSGFSPLDGVVEAETDGFSLNGTADLAADALTADLTAALKTPVSLTLSDQSLALETLTITARADGTLDAANWSAVIEGSGIETPQARLVKLTATARGRDARLRAGDRHIPALVDIAADIDAPGNPRLAALSGPAKASADLVLGTDGALDIHTLTVAAPGLTAALDGTYALDSARIKGTLAAADLAPYSALAGRPLGGAVQLSYDATATPKDGAATFAFDAQGQDLLLGVAQLDALLGGPSQMSGTLTRTAEGALSVRDVTLETPALRAALEADSDLTEITANLSAEVKTLGRLDPRMTGSLSLEASAEGPLDAPKVTATVTGDGVTLGGEAVEDLTLESALTASLTKPSGTIELAARLRGQPLTGSATLSSDETGVRRINDIALATGSTRLSGNLALAPDNTPSGTLDFASPDLSEIAPLLLQSLSGALNAHVEIVQDQGETTARMTANASKVERAGLRIGQADLSATVTGLLTTPHADGTLTASGIRSGATIIESIEASATGTADGTDFKASADLGRGDLALTGNLARTADGITLTLSEGGGQYQGLKTSLSGPAKAVIGNDGRTTIETVSLALGSGFATISGTAGDTLDVKVKLDAVPVALVNAVAPGFGLAGSLSGSASVTGAASDPTAQWSVRWSDVSASAVAGFGLPATTLNSEGQFKANTVTHTTVLGVGSSGTMTAKGSVALADAPRLDMTVTGTLPFAIAQRTLTRSGLRLDGAAALDLRIGGTAASPAISGTITTRDATAVSLNTGLVVTGLSATAQLSRDQIEITSLAGKIGGGGTLAASGTIGIGGGMPANVSLKIDDGTYTDGRIVTARIDADLTLSGPLATTPSIGGNIAVKRADITIPQAMATTLAPVSVEHVNAPGDVARQAATLRKGPKDNAAGGVNLDLTVNAPGQIYVRGRGLQAELGGRIRITGTTANPVSSGAFTLRNGTLSLLSRLLTFTRGTITFFGSFDPQLDFAATTTANSATVTVTVAGTASDPKVEFSSSPDYPQEEILALLLFDQNLSGLSATQIAQLASAVASLGGADPLDKLRKSLGVDTINITTDESNNTAVELRKKVSDNVSLGVQQGSQAGSSRVTVDIDVTKNLRARGETDANGGTKAGIFFEKEY